MIGLFIIAFWVFAIVVVVLLSLGVLQWLRGKGILANKKGEFQGYNDGNIEPDAPEATVIEGEYEKVEQNKE